MSQIFEDTAWGLNEMKSILSLHAVFVFIEGGTQKQFIDVIGMRLWRVIYKSRTDATAAGLYKSACHITGSLSVRHILNLKQHDLICDYHGVDLCYKRYGQHAKCLSSPDWNFLCNDVRVNWSNDHLCVCHTDEEFKNMTARHFTHSYSPNACPRIISIAGQIAIGIVAAVDIPAHTPITINYDMEDVMLTGIPVLYNA